MSDRWNEFFEDAQEEYGVSDVPVEDLDPVWFDKLADRADELLADDEAAQIDAACERGRP